MGKPPAAGTEIQVKPDRLLPIWLTGTFFAVGLSVFAVIPLVLWAFREALIDATVRHWGIVLAVHLYAVGWAMAAAMGAWQQLSVVAFQAKARPYTAVAGASLGMFVAGLILFLAGFALTMPSAIALGGTLLVGAFIAMATVSLGAARSGARPSLMWFFALPAQISLVAVGVVGIMLAINLRTGWLAGDWAPTFLSHLYLGPIGWFGMLVPGVSYELGPFFGLTRTGNIKGRGRLFGAVVLLLVGGLLLGLAGVASGRFHPLLLTPLALGYLLFVYDLRGIYGPRPEIRRTATLTGVRFGHGYLAVLTVVLLLVAIGVPVFRDLRWVATVGWLATAGWLSNTVAAYLHRILPFLLWHHRYWGKPKDEIKTPFVKMVDKRLGRMGFMIYNTGVVVVLLGLWWSALVSPGLLILALGTWMLVFNLGRAYLR